MTKLEMEKVKFNDGTFGVRQKMGDSYRYASGYEGCWYTYEDDIKKFCHLEERVADIIMIWESDPGTPV